MKYLILLTFLTGCGYEINVNKKQPTWMVKEFYNKFKVLMYDSSLENGNIPDDAIEQLHDGCLGSDFIIFGIVKHDNKNFLITRCRTVEELKGNN